MFSTTAPEYYINDFTKFSEALKPHTTEYEDGFVGINPDAPQSLVRPYTRLMQMGYANGWIA